MNPVHYLFDFLALPGELQLPIAYRIPTRRTWRRKTEHDWQNRTPRLSSDIR